MHDAQKIAVLDRALELLGSKGEHWAQGYYYATRNDEGFLRRTDPRDATMWCAAGACNQAAYELGLANNRDGVTADEIVAELSLREHTIHEYMMELQSFNDSPTTSFRAVRRLLKGYMEQLQTP